MTTRLVGHGLNLIKGDPTRTVVDAERNRGVNESDVRRLDHARVLVVVRKGKEPTRQVGKGTRWGREV